MLHSMFDALKQKAKIYLKKPGPPKSGKVDFKDMGRKSVALWEKIKSMDLRKLTLEDVKGHALSLVEKMQGGKYLSLGIDQGSHALRYVLVDSFRQKILKWGMCEFTNAEKDKQAAQNFLKELAKNILSTKLRTVSVNIQGSTVVIGRLEVPASDKSDLPNLVRMAMRGQLPFPVDESLFYYREFEKKSAMVEKSEAAKRIFNYIAVERKTLSAVMNPLVDVFKMVPSVTIQGYAYEQMVETFHLSAADETIAFINVGRGITAISIFYGGKLVFEREIPLAGQDITRSILILYRSETSNEMLGLSDAERLKKTGGIPDSVLEANLGDSAGELDEQDVSQLHRVDKFAAQKLFQAMQGVITAWVQDVRLSFNYYYEHYQDRKISKIYLLGGTANLKNIVPFLGEQMGIETVLLSFPERSPISISKSENAADFTGKFHEYAPALAHALKAEHHASLTIQTFQTASYSDLFASIFRVFFVLTVAIFLTMFVFMHVQSLYLKNMKDILGLHRKFLSRVETPYFDMIKWQEFMKKVESGTHPASLLMKLISQKTPPNLLLSRFSLERDQGSLLMEGSVYGNPKMAAVTIADFSKALSDSGFFKEVEIPSLEPSQMVADEATFKLTAKLVRQPGSSKK